MEVEQAASMERLVGVVSFLTRVALVGTCTDQYLIAIQSERLSYRSDSLAQEHSGVDEVDVARQRLRN